jgi:hypothetical protein
MLDNSFKPHYESIVCLSKSTSSHQLYQIHTQITQEHISWALATSGLIYSFWRQLPESSHQDYTFYGWPPSAGHFKTANKIWRRFIANDTIYANSTDFWNAIANVWIVVWSAWTLIFALDRSWSTIRGKFNKQCEGV